MFVTIDNPQLLQIMCSDFCDLQFTNTNLQSDCMCFFFVWAVFFTLHYLNKISIMPTPDKILMRKIKKREKKKLKLISQKANGVPTNGAGT